MSEKKEAELQPPAAHTLDEPFVVVVDSHCCP